MISPSHSTPKAKLLWTHVLKDVENSWSEWPPNDPPVFFLMVQQPVGGWYFKLKHSIAWDTLHDRHIFSIHDSCKNDWQVGDVGKLFLTPPFTRCFLVVDVLVSWWCKLNLFGWSSAKAKNILLADSGWWRPLAEHCEYYQPMNDQYLKLTSFLSIVNSSKKNILHEPVSVIHCLLIEGGPLPI